MEESLYVPGVILLVVLAGFVGQFGEKRKIGYGWSFVLSFILSPIIALLIVLLFDKKEVDSIENEKSDN